MLYFLAEQYKSCWSSLNVIHYLTVRAVLGLLSTLFFYLIFSRAFLTYSLQFFRSPSRAFTPENHKAKNNLPTMGGLFIVAVTVVNVLLWCDISRANVWIFLVGFIGFAILGAWDDWQKIRSRRGIKARSKFAVQLCVASVVAFLLRYTGASTTLTIPFLKLCNPDLGFLYVPWAMLVIIGCSNAVNLTDGLDGLAIGSLIPNFAAFALISYLAGNSKIATYLHIPFAHSAELAIVSAILVGASLGFLWYNTYPAQIFMGDVGSLALGAALAIIALIADQELLLVVSGGLFVVETLSVIVQVISFKVLGRRIFKMAPLHHHFELKGWPESRITTRFGIISIILCLVALITVKIR